MADQIRINGNLFSWGSIIVKVDGDRYYGFTAISYADARERVKGVGMGRAHAPRGKSSGKYSTEAVTLSGHLDSANALLSAIAEKSANGINIGSVVFEIQVQAVEGDLPPVDDEILGCTISKLSTSLEESPDPLKRDIEIDCTHIKHNGFTLYDS